MNKNRVTEEQIEAKIKDKKFTVLEDGKTTICNLYLENGFTVRGESACVDPANFDKELGEKIAYENAFKKIWLLEGYLLQEKLYRQPESYIDRMEVEGKELEERLQKAIDDLEKLRRQFNAQEKDPEKVYDPKDFVSVLDIDLLQAQITAMATYSNILLMRFNVARNKNNLPTVAHFK